MADTLSLSEDADRVGFGHWLSGFADGEATFALRLQTHGDGRFRYQSYFRIGVRADDADVLRSIRSYWGCGSINFSIKPRSAHLKINPAVTYGVQRLSDLTGIVIPHFERFPLRAKKRGDFEIWREGVLLAATVAKRPFKVRDCFGSNGHSGTYPKWTEAEREQFASLAESLREQRRYIGANAAEA